MLPTEVPTPAFVNDGLAAVSAVERHVRRLDEDLPIVGFCGCVEVDVGARSSALAALRRALWWSVLSRPGLERVLRRFGFELTRSEGKRVRYQALGVVMRSRRVRNHFLLRDHRDIFSEATLRLPEDQRRHSAGQALREFQENVLESDYTLCPRGGGNWSYRLYETLCLGRIPVFFDTDCALPYESLIDWREHCVWVEADHIEETPDAILRHYRARSAAALEQSKNKCHEFWLKHLSLDGFFRNFHRHAVLREAMETQALAVNSR